MRSIYYLWLFSNVFLSKFNKKLENFIFFYNNDRLYRFSTLNVFQRIFLIYFYNPNYYTRLKLSQKNFKKLSLDRLENCRAIHNFMVYSTLEKKNLFKKKSSIKNANKTKYSFAKLVCNGVVKNTVVSHTDFLQLIILFSKINKAIKSYKLNFFWETLIPKSSSLINVVMVKNLLNHINSEVSFNKYNLSTLLGFYNFFLNLDDYKCTFVSDELNDRQSKLLNSGVNKNVFYKKITDINVKKHQLVLNRYKKFYKTIFVGFDFNTYSNPKLYSYFKNLNDSAIVLEKNFYSFYKDLLKIKHIPTDVSQYFTSNSNITSLFIRKNKIFNKGRYSRNRQLYRTGVYWCLILNILGVFGLYYYFYRFTFNFGYFYIPLCILILSIFGSRLVKYRFYNAFNILNEISLFAKLIDSFIHIVIVKSYVRSKKFCIKTYYLFKFKVKFFFLNLNYNVIKLWRNL